jgi:hypothetical protein
VARRARHCETVGRDPAEIRKTRAGSVLKEPFEDIDGYFLTLERYAALGIDLVNVGALPGNPDPAGFLARLGDEVVPRLAQIG